MWSKIFFVLLLGYFVSKQTYAQRDKKFFRKDYKYIEATEAFYKFHTLRTTWIEAKRMCALEGARLFYPQNDDEARAVLSFWNGTQPFQWIFVGISDLIVKNVYETIDGTPVGDVYNKWLPGEPNDTGGAEDCVVFNKLGTYNDDKCTIKLPFICKKTLQTLEWNRPCNIPILDYIYNEAEGKCYKLHNNAISWSDAYKVCTAEQSYLAVLNSQRESNQLISLTEQLKERISGGLSNETVHVGFHNRLGDGWQTVKGTTVDESGYSNWDVGQPDGSIQGVEENCGAMSSTGRLNDIPCDKKSFFICEHDAPAASPQIYEGWQLPQPY